MIIFFSSIFYSFGTDIYPMCCPANLIKLFFTRAANPNDKFIGHELLSCLKKTHIAKRVFTNTKN